MRYGVYRRAVAAAQASSVVVPAEQFGIVPGTSSPGPDIASKLQSAIDSLTASGGGIIELPQGYYRIGSTVTLKRRTGIRGASMMGTIIDVPAGVQPIRLFGGSYDFPDNELYCSVENFHFSVSTSSTSVILRIQGHRNLFTNLLFTGGSANSGCWAMDFDMSNVFHVENVHIGDAVAGFNWFGNGIRFQNSENKAVNYGDGYIEMLDIRLGSNNTDGVSFLGPENGNMLNNITIDKANIIAPGRTGCTAIRIKNSRRLVFNQVDMEAITNGVIEQGKVGTSGAYSESNVYIACYCINVTTPYQDNNDANPYKVRRRIFLGCHGFPTGIACTDTGASFIGGDDVCQQAIWLEDPVSGRLTFRFGAYPNFAGCYLTDGTQTDGSDGTRPRGGLRFVVTGNNARIEPSDQGSTSGNDVRLFMGRSDRTMRGIFFDCPLVVATISNSAGPVSPIDGMLVYADGTNWNPGGGAGLYFREGGTWKKITMA